MDAAFLRAFWSGGCYLLLTFGMDPFYFFFPNFCHGAKDTGGDPAHLYSLKKLFHRLFLLSEFTVAATPPTGYWNGIPAGCLGLEIRLC